MRKPLLFFVSFVALLVRLPPLVADAAPAPRYAGSFEATQRGQALYFAALKTDYEVSIRDDVASVSVVQRFANPACEPLPAHYRFPLRRESDATVEIRVGDERIRGRDVARLLPGRPIEVRVHYVQAVPKVGGDYELVIPLLLGPRAHATALPAAIEPGRVSLRIRLNGGRPIARAASDTHALTVRSRAGNLWDLALAPNRVIDNRDFVLHYELGADALDGGLLVDATPGRWLAPNGARHYAASRNLG
jgi:Ca-activated chloride channel family protein